MNPVNGSAPLHVYLNAVISENQSTPEIIWNIEDESGHGISIIDQDKIDNIFRAGTYKINLTVADSTTRKSVTKILKVFESQTDAMIETDCNFPQDPYNYVNIYAKVAESEGKSCSGELTATIDDMLNVSFNKYSGCYFSKYIILPGGLHRVTFQYKHPIETKFATCIFKVPYQTNVDIKISEPRENKTYAVNSLIFVEVTGFVNGRIAKDGKITVYYENESVELNNFRGVFKGFIKFRNTGLQNLTFEFKYGLLETKKEIKVNISETSEDVAGARIKTYFPANINTNVSESLRVQVYNWKGLLEENARVKAEVYYDSQVVDTFDLPLTGVFYTKVYSFKHAGIFTLRITAEFENNTLVDKKEVKVGTPVEISKVENFTIIILNPQENETYSTEANIKAIAKILLNNSPISAANVLFKVDDEILNSTYEGFGEYSAILPILPEGIHSLSVFATYGSDFVANKSIDFSTSEHRVIIKATNPGENDEVFTEKGGKIELIATVVDETNDIAVNALVLGELISPNGMKTNIQFSMDQNSGRYIGIFYPLETGIYQLKITAKKQGHVSDSVSLRFKITVKEEKISLLGFLTTENLVLIAIVLGIIALLLIIFKFLLH
ncbi:MAG: hypothetical protein QXJ62_00475 [Nitrososphaeria archaeon]